MNENSFNRRRQTVWFAGAILMVALLGYVLRKHGVTNGTATSHAAEQESRPPAVVFHDYQPPAGEQAQPTLKLDPDTVMASVNGHALAAADVLPPGSFDQRVSLDVCQYFLQRAVDRELILQTAKAQGVVLDESQRQQMLDFKTAREQHGPGLVRDLNGSAGEISFEMRDAEAFMLQTSLLEKSGASPNITSAQVLAYYQQHASDFGELPVEENARLDTWSKIDFQIREKLASAVRSDFQNRLVAYMSELKARADIKLTPLHPSQAQ